MICHSLPGAVRTAAKAHTSPTRDRTSGALSTLTARPCWKRITTTRRRRGRLQEANEGEVSTTSTAHVITAWMHVAMRGVVQSR